MEQAGVGDRPGNSPGDPAKKLTTDLTTVQVKDGKSNEIPKNTEPDNQELDKGKQNQNQTGSTEVPKQVLESAFKSKSEAPMHQKLIDEVLSSLPLGDLTPIIEQQTAYLLMRLVSKKEGHYEVEIASIAKSPFSPWFEREKKEISIKCFDSKLCGDE